VEETHGKFDADFKDSAVRLIRRSRNPIAQVAREPGIKGYTLRRHFRDTRPDPAGGSGG
jgi:transposase